MSPPLRATGKKHSESGLSRLVGSGTAGAMELLTFHPVDTVAKRLMSNHKPIFISGEKFSAGMMNMRHVIFRDAAEKTAMQRYLSLFPGLGFAAGYKILQRIYKFGGQPFALDFISNHYKEKFNGAFGAKTGKTIMHATAGR